MKATFALFALLALATPPAALAQEEQGEETGELHGEIVVGPQYYADTDNRSSAKFEEFRDVPNGFVASRFVLSWVPRENWFFNLDTTDVTQNDQRLFANFGKQDVWRTEIYWLENPRLWTDDAHMLFGNNAEGQFTLEDSFQAAVRAAPASALPAGDADLNGIWDPGTKGFLIDQAIQATANPVFLGHQRALGGARFQYNLSRKFTFAAMAERERRSGTAPQNLGMYFALAPAEVAAPLDYRTDLVGTSLEYTARRFNLGISATGSSFDLRHDSVTWDDQLFLVDEAVNVNQANPGHGRMTFGTDNQWAQVAVRGGLNLAARTRVDASFSTSRTTQDDPFLPMTINTLLVAAPLPAGSYDGEYNTDTYDLRVSSRPFENWRFRGWTRSYDVENKSPSLLFVDTVVTDFQFPLCGNVNLPCDANNNDVLDDRIPRRSLPYDYARRNTGVQVGWEPLGWLDGSLTYEREDLDRDFSAVESSSEDSYKITLDFDAASWLFVRTLFRTQERRADEYHAHYLEESFPNGEPTEAAFNEGTRRFYWTDRDRDSYSLQFDVTPAARWTIYGELTGYNEDYFDPETGQAIGTSFTVQEDRDFNGTPETYDILLAGRTENKGQSQALGFTYTPGARFDLFADVTHETWDYALASRYRNVTAGVGTDNPLDNWTSDADDDYDTLNAGFFWKLSEDRVWTLRGDFTHSEGTSLISTAFVPGGSGSGDTSLPVFPEVSATLDLATLDLTRAPRGNFSYSLRYWYEAWDEDNFASDFNLPYMGNPNQDPSMANAVFLGIDFGDYTNHILSFLVRYTY